MEIAELPVLSDQELRRQFSDNSHEVLDRRYLRKDENGETAETVADLFMRVAHNIAAVEAEWDSQPEETETLFYKALTHLRFLPNSPTFTGAGTPLGQLAACFVLPIEDDMGRTEGGIFQSLRDAALIQQTGGGNGFSFSRLRPKNSLVVSSMGQATGPTGFLRVYDRAFGEIAQGGTRRGANMAVLRVDHPDIQEFVTCKTAEDAITNFNISVGILDSFMEAVEDDREWQLRFPAVQHDAYRDFTGGFEDAEALGIPLTPYHTIKARDLFDTIVNQAWRNGEPGLLFLDRAQEDHPLPLLGRYESTNPCGEQFLMPYENCCLGSINLAQHLTVDDASEPIIDWQAIADTVSVAVRFLDDVVSANAYVPAVPQLKQAAHQARRIGLGIMGFADLLYHMSIAYGSPEAQEMAAQVMEFIRYRAMLSSIELAAERGPFPLIESSIYSPNHVVWQPRAWPAWLQNGPTHDWGRPDINWDGILEGIQKHGIRNATQLTIAPTGTIATISGIEGYGCEPTFALAYTRYVHESDEQIPLPYVSPRFETALEAAGLSLEERRRIQNAVKETGSCQSIEGVPDEIKHVFVVAGDIPAEGHIHMQAALQLFVDASISKTVNFPAGTSPEEVADAFKLAWRLGCKGLTAYVAGSREAEVLETQATRRQKQRSPDTTPDPTARLSSDTKPGAAPSGGPTGTPHSQKRPRPKSLRGVTYQSQTPLGTAYVTINTNGDDQPFEVFLNVGKAGSDTAAVAEAIGRLISLSLRLPSPLEPRERLSEIAQQLSGIGGRSPMGFGHNRVLSLPDGVANVLQNYLRETEEDPDDPQPRKELPQTNPGPFRVGDLCPACGQAALINTEGCRRCYACGHSEC